MTARLVPPPVLARLAAAIAKRGGRAMAVGGCVRDFLLGTPLNDWDVEVFGLPADVLEAELRPFGRVDLVGRAFGVFKLTTRGGECFDVSLPRRDSKVGPGHRGIEAVGDPTLPISEAARRRDLTVNAIFADLVTGELVDPAGGLADLAAGRLAAVDSETFLEDPLRALRVVQFSARLGFEVVPELIALCRRAPLDELPPERICGEWEKLLLKSTQPARGLAVAREADILSRVFPEVIDRPERDAALDALVPVRAALAPAGRQWALMLACWLADHEPRAIVATLDRLWLHKHGGFPLREAVSAVVAHWRDPATTDAHLRWLSTRCEPVLALAVREVLLGDVPPAMARAAALGIATAAPAPWVLGRDLTALGIEPGPAMGHLLRALYAEQLDGSVSSRAEALERARLQALPA